MHSAGPTTKNIDDTSTGMITVGYYDDIADEIPPLVLFSSLSDKQRVFVTTLLWLLSGLSAILYFLGTYVIDSIAVAAVFKTLPALCLPIIVALWRDLREKVSSLLCVALLFCMLGDLALALPYSSTFLVGVAAFFCAHMCWIPGLSLYNPRLHILRYLPFLGALIALSCVLYSVGGMSSTPVLFGGLVIYATALTAFGWRAASTIEFPINDGDNAAQWMFGAAGVLFVFSDFFLATNKFVHQVEGSTWYIMISYWLSISLVAIACIRRGRGTGGYWGKTNGQTAGLLGEQHNSNKASGQAGLLSNLCSRGIL